MHDILRESAPARDWAAIRRDFPILDQSVHGHPLVYLDNAATSQKPRQVLDAILHYYERDNSNVHRGIHELSNRATASYEGARKRTAEFIQAASPDEIIFTRGTTEGINLVAQAWGTANVRKGQKILLTEMEHHSNIVPWQLLAARTGAELLYVPVTGDTGELDLDVLDSHLRENVRIFAMTHISNTLGVVNPVAELCAKARALGITTLVDAAQSAGHLPLNVQEIGCDFLAYSGHKICAPTGVGILYGRAEILEATPPWQGGGEMISSVDFFTSRWNTIPHKFEAGTPHMEGAVGLHAAMDYLDEIGRRAIFRHDQELASVACAQLAEIPGIRLFGPPLIDGQSDRAGVVSFLLADAHAHDIVSLADTKGVALRGGHHCNQPLMRKLGVKSTARASFYFYNTIEEVDRFVTVIRDIQKFFTHGT